MFYRIAKFASDTTLGPREIRVVASTSVKDRAGDVMVPGGCEHKNFDVNPIVIADHNPSLPIGNAKISVTNYAVMANITFAPPGISAKADEYCQLYKSGIMSAVSIGFSPVEYEQNNDGGYTFKRWELLELSCVAVPCNPATLVVQRAYHAKSGAVLSQENAAHKAAALKCMKAMSDCHGEILNIRDRLAGLHDDLADVLYDYKKHLRRAVSHMHQIGQRKPKPAPDDGYDGTTDDDDPPPAQDEVVVPGSDPSAAPWSPRRSFDPVGLGLDLLYPVVPASFKAIDPARQVRVFVTDEREAANGDRLLERGAELDAYCETRGVCLNHDRRRPVAWCSSIRAEFGKIYATAQFPPRYVSRRSDKVFEAVKSGALPAVSAGYSIVERSGENVTRWLLREISFAKVGANPLCKVLSVGGVELQSAPIGASGRRAWDDPRAPHRPEYLECGGTDAHFAAALRRMPSLLAAAQWRN
jgi:HK97 family phage prohead protease